MVEHLPGVRTVPISTRSLTGQAIGSAYESSLERDLLILHTFDDEVIALQTQPVEIHFQDSKGKWRKYTPDVRIIFRERPSLLCEVKYRKDLDAADLKLEDKLMAGHVHAAQFGWEFDVFDEHRIRTDKLKNINFLWQHFVAAPNPPKAHEPQILAAFASRGNAPRTQSDVLAALYPDLMDRARAISSWWHMVAHKRLLCDLEQPLDECTFYRPAAEGPR